MTNIEKLVEAVSYAADNDMEWWEIFNSEEEALNVLYNAAREDPDEYEVIQLLTSMDEDPVLGPHQIMFKKCLRKLKNRYLKTKEK